MNQINVFMKKNFNIIIYLLFVFSIIIDNVNGFLIQEMITKNITLGQIYRMITIVVLLYYFFISYSKKDKKILIFLIFLFILPIAYAFINKNFALKILISEYMYQFKLLYPILIIFVLKKMYDNNIFDKTILTKILKFYRLFAPLSIIIPKLLNLGYEAYMNSGYRGFYVANNEINIVLLVTYILSLNHLYNLVNIKNIFTAIINLIALLLIGSKTSLIIIACSIFVYLFKIMKNNKNKKVICIFCAFILIIPLVFKDFLLSIYNRFLYFYDVLVIKGNNSFLTFLLSGRDTRILPAIEKNILNNDLGIFNFLFGVGRENQFDPNVLVSLIEMDFFDTFIWYGIITALVILFIYSKILFNSIKNHGNKIFIIIYSLILVFSFIAGHVWFSPLAGGIFAIIASVLVMDEKRGEKDDQN